MTPMKAGGYREIELALARLRKLHASGRISRQDKEFIEERLEEALTRIVQMSELDGAGEEVTV